jgi:hypothetical protein
MTAAPSPGQRSAAIAVGLRVVLAVPEAVDGQAAPAGDGLGQQLDGQDVEHRLPERRAGPRQPDDVERAARLVAAAGLVTDPASDWRRVSACVGRPSCARALADVRALAAQVVPALGAAPDGSPTRVHLAGCERRCGRPTSAHREVVATGRELSVADVAPASASDERASRQLASVAPSGVLAAVVDPHLHPFRPSEDP